MGANVSVTDQLNKTINDVTTNVLAKNTAKTSALTEQEQTLVIDSIKGRVSGITQQQIGTISLTSLMNTQQNAQIQEKLNTAINIALEKKAITLGISVEKTNIKNIVENHIKTTFKTENIQKMNAAIEQKQKLIISNVDDVGVVETIKQTQTVDVVLKQISDMSSNMAKDLVASTKSEVKSSMSMVPFIVLGVTGVVVAVIGLVYLNSKSKMISGAGAMPRGMPTPQMRMPQMMIPQMRMPMPQYY